MYNSHFILYNFYSRYIGGNIIIPNLIETDIEFGYTNKKGGIIYSDDIALKINTMYVKGMKNFIQDIKDKTKGKMFNFTIISYNIGNEYEPLYAKGSYTAVYIIKDTDKKINDSKDNTYILRLASRIASDNMFNNPKIKLEYTLFSEYLSKIYYYGTVPGLKFSSEKNYGNYRPRSIIDYNITKKYNTYDYERPNLTNQQKFDFLLSNLDMLHTLSKNNYVHTDYKISNIGWESNEEMNVILIDYDFNTLLKLDENDTNYFIIDSDKIILKVDRIVSTFPPRYLSLEYRENAGKWNEIRQNKLDREKIYNLQYTDVNKYNKYSVGGLINIIETLDIKYNFNILQKNDPPYFINISHPVLEEQYGLGKFSIKKLNAYDMTSSLNLYSNDYELIPTYEQLYNLFLELGRDGHISDVKVT